ncbi:MAG: hypothetical protein Tsb0010_17370 [Parvularculaceae bacterium]
MPELLSDNTVLIYCALLIGPFIQEDAATVAAASFAASGAAHPEAVYGAFLAALLVSDVWKYWLGRAAHRFEWARRHAASEAVAHAGAALKARLARTILTVRFIPGARIATYVAAGYVKAPFTPFFFYLALSGAIYVGVIFGAFMFLGEALGEQVKAWLPFAALGLVSAYLMALLVRRALSRFAKTH